MLLAVIVFFVLAPFLATPFVIMGLFLDKSMKNKKIYAIMLAILIALLLYYFIPDESKDLSRYYTIMGQLSTKSIGELWEYALVRDDPMSWTYFYTISKLGNHNLVMIFTTLISYSILFYVVFDHQKKAKISNLDFGMVLVFMLSTFYLVDDITGVRFCIGRLVFFLALYLEMYKGVKKRRAIALYIISALMHSSCILFIGLRFLLKIMKNKFNLPMSIILVLLSLSPNIVVFFADNLSGVPFLSNIGEKAAMYLRMTSGFYPMFILQVVIGLLLFAMLLYVRNKKISNEKYVNFVLVILFLGLLTMGTTSFSTRFIRSGIVFALPIIMDYLKILKAKYKVWVYTVITGICLASVPFQVSHLSAQTSYGTLFDDGIFKNIVMLLLKM